MGKKKLRRLGDIMLDIEPLLLEMTSAAGHDLQWHEVLYLVFGWLNVHAPHAREDYVSGGSPEFYYGAPRSSDDK